MIAFGADDPQVPPATVARGLRDDCARAAGLDPSPFDQLIVTRYLPMEFNERGTRPDFRVRLPRRSLLVMDGEARTALRHRIPQVKAVRHSISFRTIRARDDR